jgi:hypothetical protein
LQQVISHASNVEHSTDSKKFPEFKEQVYSPVPSKHPFEETQHPMLHTSDSSHNTFATNPSAQLLSEVYLQLSPAKVNGQHPFSSA